MSIIEEPIVKTAVEIDVPVVDDREAERRELLLRAAEIIETDGYQHGADGMRPGGPYCMLGAIAHAMGARTFMTVRVGGGHRAYAHEPPANVVGLHWQTVSRWNDQLIHIPRKPKTSRWRRRRLVFGVPDPAAVVARALRRLANGASWNDATHIEDVCV